MERPFRHRQTKANTISAFAVDWMRWNLWHLPGEADLWRALLPVTALGWTSLQGDCPEDRRQPLELRHRFPCTADSPEPKAVSNKSPAASGFSRLIYRA